MVSSGLHSFSLGRVALVDQDDVRWKGFSVNRRHLRLLRPFHELLENLAHALEGWFGYDVHDNI